MPSTDYSEKFLLYNAQTSKNLVVAVEIDGLSTILSTTNIYKTVAYGDPGIFYGTPGLVYGGLVPYDDFKPILSLDGSSLTIQQKIEPEQGRASVTMLTLSFIDKDQFMTRLISPGVILDDLLGKQIKVYLGYKEISFPADYCLIFRGRVSSYDSQSGMVHIQISDPNMIRRQQLFFSAVSQAASAISASATTIPVVSIGDYTQQVVGPNGTYDDAVTTYIKIDDEWISYPATGIDSANNRFVGVTRGVRDTDPAVHDIGSDVTAALQLEDNGIIMALKIMLSGWQGPYIEDLSIQNFVHTNDPTAGDQPKGILLPPQTNAVTDYGIAPGDYLSVTGSSNPANDGVCQVVSFISTATNQNQAIITDKTFVSESASPGTFSARSQYDTYPDTCGLMMPGYEVDVARHQDIFNVFLGSEENTLRFLLQAPEDSGKTFLESQIYLPLSCYSITRFGRMSMQLTHAPIADQRLQIIQGSNCINPMNTKIARGVNFRKFFNEIQYDYDYDDEGSATKTIKSLDTTSITVIGVSSVLPISAKGLHSDLTSITTLERRVNYLLSRYKSGAMILTLETNFATGVQIEAGDVVVVKDGGVLQISNLVTGSRDLGSQLFEVINRTLDIKSGKCKLELVAGLGADVTDRFATVSPASNIKAGSDSTHIKIEDSYGTQYPGQEYLKWINYLGERAIIHTSDWSTAATCLMVSLSPSDFNTIIVSGLGISPTAGMIMDVDLYPQNTDPEDQQTIKLVHAFNDPTVVATSGFSSTSFQVAASGIGRFIVGLPVYIHNNSYSRLSVNSNVVSASTGTNIVVVDTDLGFTPSAGDYVELIGFADGGGAYRLI